MVSVRIGNQTYRTEVQMGKHNLISDEPIDKSGQDLGPTPKQLLLGSLGSCIAITLKMYVNRKEWDTGDIKVELSLDESGTKPKIHKKVILEKEVDEAQLKRILIIATKCHVSKMLTNGIDLIEEEAQLGF